ncbi:MAG: hypothetical protein SFW62_06490 [Alphaproteobacteria bacterium]|nr:hypothetical protein [Alphaproteobacteria bacterium]
MLARRDILKKVKGAFLPFRCAVQIGDYTSKLRFQVFDHNGIIEISRIPLRQAQNERQLRSTLERIRYRLEDEGYAFRSSF